MILTSQYIKEIVSEYFSDKPVKRVWLFGSYARGEAKEESDVDLLVEVDRIKQPRWSYFDLAKFLVDLEEKFKRKVDLMHDEALLHSWVKKGFESDKQLIFTDE